MKSISKNYLYNTVYNILNILIPLVTAPYLARILGTDGVGTYAYYFAIAQYFSLFAKLGLDNYGTRRLAQVRDNKEEFRKQFSNIYALQVGSTLCAAFIYFLWVVLFAENKCTSSIFGLWIICVAFDTDWVLFAIEDFKTAAVRSCVVKLIAAIMIFALVKHSEDVWKYALITVISYSGGYIFLWVKCRNYIAISDIKASKVIEHLKPCFILMIPVLAMSVYRTMDKIMLGSISNMNQTGLYEYAEKLIYAMTSFIASLGTVMMPRMANLAAKKDTNTSKSLLEKSISFIMFLACAMCFGTLSISNSIVPILYGQDFKGSIVLLNLLAVTLIFIGWSNVIRTQYVIPNGKDRIYIGSITTGAICNLIFNALLIPKYAAVGACIGTIIAEFSVPIYQVVKLHKNLEYKKFIIDTWPFLVFGIAMYFICKGIESKLGIGLVPMLIQIIVGGIAYLMLSLLYFSKVLHISFAKKRKYQ